LRELRDGKKNKKEVRWGRKPDTLFSAPAAAGRKVLTSGDQSAPFSKSYP